MIFKQFERHAFIALIITAMGCFIVGCYSLIDSGAGSGKWLASSGLLATAAGVFQLEVSGLFKKIMGFYGDEGTFPYDPPSHITQQIIDNPDRPFVAWVRNACFFNIATGFWLIISGTLIQLLAIWI